MMYGEEKSDWLSSGEAAGEQPERSGVSGAKERGQGERGTATPCAGHRAGKACHRGCHKVREAAKQRKKERTIAAAVPPLTVEALKPHSSP